MVELPAVMPATVPDVPTVAFALLLLHVPLPVASLNVVDEPAQTLIVPVIAAGNGFTVTAAVTLQPGPDIYDIVAVPFATPLTIPLVPILAIAELLLLQAPPETDSPSEVVRPVHTFSVPVIEAGTAFIVTVTFLVHPETNV